MSQQIEKKLSDKDQAKVDAFLKRGVNAVKRKPFRPLWLLLGVVAAVSILSLLSLVLVRIAGVG